MLLWKKWLYTLSITNTTEKCCFPSGVSLRVKETKAISTSACSFLQVPVLGADRKRFSRRVKNEHNSEGGDAGTQALCSARTWPGGGIRRWLPRGVRNSAQQLLQEVAAPQPWPRDPRDGSPGPGQCLQEPPLLFWLHGCSRQLWRQGGSHVPWPHYRSGLNSFSYFICQIIWALWKLNPVCISLVYVLVYYKAPWNLTQMLPLCKNYHSSFKIQLFNILTGKKKKRKAFLGWHLRFACNDVLFFCKPCLSL